MRELLGLVQPEGKDEVLKIVRKIDKQLDEKESGPEVFNDLIELKPGIFGITFNLNGLFKRILGREKQKRR